MRRHVKRLGSIKVYYCRTKNSEKVRPPDRMDIKDKTSEEKSPESSIETVSDAGRRNINLHLGRE